MPYGKNFEIRLVGSITAHYKSLRVCMALPNIGGNTMKVWNKPQVREQEVGLEVTSYLPAEIDII